MTTPAPLPITRTPQGLLLGPLLLGLPEETHLRELLRAPYDRPGFIPAYNGTLYHHANPDCQSITLGLRADRLLSTQSAPRRDVTLHAAVLLDLITDAPDGDLSPLTPVSADQDALLLGTERLPLPRNLRGRLLDLTAELPYAIIDRWYGTFDLATHGDHALLDTESTCHLISTHDLRRALRAALHCPEETPPLTA